MEVIVLGNNLSRQDIDLVESIRGLSEEINLMTSELGELKTKMNHTIGMKINLSDLSKHQIVNIA
jgi:hypothetical protein